MVPTFHTRLRTALVASKPISLSAFFLGFLAAAVAE
jgi:hypothetical protein